MSRKPSDLPTGAAQSRQIAQPGGLLRPARSKLPRGLTLLAMAAIAAILLLRLASGLGWLTGPIADAVWIDLFAAAALVAGIVWLVGLVRARRRDEGAQGQAETPLPARHKIMATDRAEGGPVVVEPGVQQQLTQLCGDDSRPASTSWGDATSTGHADEAAQPARGVAAANTLPVDLEAAVERAVPRPIAMTDLARVDRDAPTSAITKWSPSRRSPVQSRPKWDAGVRRVVIVGNGIAGLTAAETVRAHHPQCEIHLIGREKQASYRRTAVTRLISQRCQLPELALRPDIWYAEQRIHCWLNTRATTLDVDRQVLTLASMDELHYDRLILAMGANARVPQALEGFGVPGSFVLRSAADALALRAFVQRYGARRAVVLGAGLLGIETADALHQMGLAVHLLVQGDQVLDHQLDRDAAALVTAQLRHIGIKVSTHVGLRALHRSGSDRLSRVRLTSGQVIEAELLVVCSGARPDTALAEAAGIAVDRGVLVDDHLRASAPGVYACGDVAQTAVPLPGLWAPAAEQGHVAALNALGLATRYEQQVPVVTLRLTGLQVRSAGQLHAEGPGQIELCHRPPTAANRAVLPDAVDLASGYPPGDGAAADDLAGKSTATPPPRPLASFHTAERYTKVVVEIDAKGREHVLGAIVVGDDPDGEAILAAACTSAPSSSLGAALMQRPWQRQRGALIEPRPHSLTPSRPVLRDEAAGVENEAARKPRRVA